MIAHGTPTELKRELATDVLDVTVDDGEVARVGELLQGIGLDAPRVDHEARKVSIAVDGGASSLVEAVRRLDDERIRMVDITLRRPSLDDVFLALTGHTTVRAGDDDPEDVR